MGLANSRITNIANALRPTAGTTHQSAVAGAAASFILPDGAVLSDFTTQVWLQFTGGAARVTFDGVTDPSADVGMSMPAGSFAVWDQSMFHRARVVREGDDDCTIQYQEMSS